MKLEEPTKSNSYRWPLTQGKTTLIDRPIPRYLYEYRWVAVLWNFRYYAYAYKKCDGSCAQVAMHRLIASTPPNEITHHLNPDSLDNRRGNLLNMTPHDHKQLHGIRRFGRKKKNKTTINNKPQT